MIRLVPSVVGVVVVTCLVALPSTAFAQAFIVGVVRDTSGAILPGVTVEAASPALIEKILPEEIEPIAAFLAATAGPNRAAPAAQPADAARAAADPASNEARAIMQRQCTRCHDMATAAIYLASDAGSWVTGQILTVAGGL